MSDIEGGTSPEGRQVGG